MNLRDQIGKRGENIFRVLITRWCDGKPWFEEVFLGEKHETKDFVVYLLDAPTGSPCFYVQVKATRGRYTGSGRHRKLAVKVSAKDVARLKAVPGPAFVVGIDISTESRGYIAAITPASKPMSGLPLRHPINCRTIEALWKEVHDYWKMNVAAPTRSRFSTHRAKP